MSDIKWVKITTDMFDNRKIKYLRKLPDGNSIVLIWVMLLTMAGRCNAGGMIFLTENIPYTPKMLADELEFDENTVRLALTALEQLGMIQTDGFLMISGWEEYQNVDKMDRIRQQTRERVARHRQRQSLLAGAEATQCNATSNATVTPSNATDKEIEIEKEKDIECNNIICASQETFGEIERGAAKREDTQSAGYSDRFQEFWEAYPRKDDKRLAYNAYQARLKNGYKPEDMIAAAKAYAMRCRREHTEKKYIKCAKTFIGPNEPFAEYIPKEPEKPAEQGGNPFAEYTVEILEEDE